MPNNPASRRAGAKQVAAGNKIVRNTALNNSVSAAASTVQDSVAADSANSTAGSTPVTTYATAIQETSGPTILDINAIADGEYLKRVGSAVISHDPLTGGVTATVTLAKLTGGGANGSISFTKGLATTVVNPT